MSAAPSHEPHLRRSPLLPLLICAGWMVGCTPPQPERLAGSVMGTTWSVQIVGVAGPDLQDAIQDRLDTINAQMTTYSPASELSRFNSNSSTEWLPASAALVAVVTEAQRVAGLSGGAFDVTAGPLVELWGFGAGEAIVAPPAPAAVAVARARVGFADLYVRAEPGALRKSRPDLAVDLSALAKGFAVDEVARLLDGRGLSDYLVEVGGELKSRGRNARGEIWTIAVEQPRAGERRVQRAFALRDMAVATSGDYRNFFEVEGRRYSHTIDPRDGQPVAHSLAAVTVLSPSAMTADALATALMVLGPEDGYQLALAQNLAALFLMRESAGFREQATPAFRASTTVR